MEKLRIRDPDPQHWIFFCNRWDPDPEKVPYETPPRDIVTQVSDEAFPVQVGLEVGVLVHLPTRQPGHLQHTPTTKVIGAPLEHK
jgi:hypothetical protein